MTFGIEPEINVLVIYQILVVMWPSLVILQVGILADNDVSLFMTHNKGSDEYKANVTAKMHDKNTENF